MKYVEKLLALDKALKMKLPMAPIATRSKAEDMVKRILHADAQAHVGKIAEVVGVYRA